MHKLIHLNIRKCGWQSNSIDGRFMVTPSQPAA
jgi:hypothetical protein